MTITEVRMVKNEGAAGPDGTSYDVEFDVDFTGIFDPVAAANLTIFTPIGLAAMDISGSVELIADSGIYPGTRRIRLDHIADGSSPGMFTIVVPFAEGSARVANPNDRKDEPVFRRDGKSLPVARDRNGRLVGTYASVPEGPFVFGGEKVIEIFATLPQIPVGSFSLSISGYRTSPKIAFETYAISGPPANDPTKQQQWTVVNNAPVEVKGITFPRGTLGLISAIASPLVVNGFATWKHDWQFQIAPTFNLKLLNAGNYFWDSTKPAGFERQRIRDKSNNFPPGPSPLDKSGKPLEDGFKPTDAVYVNFETTREVNFATEFAFRF